MRFFANIFLALFAISAFLFIALTPQTVLASPGDGSSLAYLALRQDKESGGLVEEGETEPSAIQSAWGAIAFAAAGFDPSTVGAPSLLQYVEKNACSYANVTDIERIILVALASGRDPRDFGGCNMLSLLNALANEDGSIGPDIVSTIFGTIAKSASGEEVEEKIFNFIINAQEKDGGWDSGWGTEANITAQALIALSYKYEQSSIAIVSAKNYLKNLQVQEGGIKYDNNSWTSFPDAFSNAYTLQAIYALGEKETDDFWLSASGKTITDDLLSLREEDGFYNFSLPFGAVNPVFTTAIAVPPLYGKTLGFIGNNLTSFALNNEQENDLLPASVAEETPTHEGGEKKEKPLVRTPKIVVAYNENNATIKDKVDETQNKIQPPPLSASLPNQESSNKLISILVVCGSVLIGLALSFALGKLKIFLLFLVALAIFYPVGARAGQAGVVVRHSSGEIVTKCVDFGTQESMTGTQILEKSGLNPQFYNGFIFAINGESAKKYNEPGAGNDYWSYWRADSIGNWIYSSLGPKSNNVRDGEVDGWQRGGSSLLLPTIKLSDICPALEVQAPLSPTSEHSTPPNNTQEEKLTQETVASSNKTTESKQTLPLKIDEGKQESTANKKDNLPSWLLPTTLCAFLLGLLLPRIIKK